MTDVVVTIEDVDPALKEIATATLEIESALAGGVYEGAQVLMDAWQEVVWRDTGALADSEFVSEPLPPPVAPESIAGFVAPYAGIVEETHPTEPNLLARTYANELNQITQAIIDTSIMLIDNGQGLADVPSRYPTEGTFTPRRSTRRRRGRG